MRRKQGKPSVADKTAPVLAFTRPLPPPPAELTPAQAEVWKSVVASPTGAMLSPEMAPLIIEYCRAVERAAVVARQVEAFEPEWISTDGGLPRWDRLLRIADRAAGRVASLAVKLRLSPSTRYRADRASVIADQPGAGLARPWDGIPENRFARNGSQNRPEETTTWKPPRRD